MSQKNSIENQSATNCTLNYKNMEKSTTNDTRIGKSNQTFHLFHFPTIVNDIHRGPSKESSWKLSRNSAIANRFAKKNPILVFPREKLSRFLRLFREL